MMWNDSKSLVLSKVCVILFMTLLIIGVVAVPITIGEFINSRVGEYISDGFAYDGSANITADAYIRMLTVIPIVLFRLTIFAGAVPAGAILVLLYKLLSRIGKGEIFIKKNVDCLRHISWCCFVGTIICLLSMFYWLPWGAVGIAAAFMGLLLRVIKNVFAKAVSLQDEADLTV